MTKRFTARSFCHFVKPSPVVDKRMEVCSSRFILFKYLYAYDQCAHDVKYSHTYQHLSGNNFTLLVINEMFV